MLASVTVNWGAVLVAGVVNMILGWLWYSPMLFGKSWMQLMGVKEMKMNPKNLLLMFVIALVIAYMFTYFIVYAGANTFGLGLEVGLMASVAFTALTSASGTVAGDQNWKLWSINAGYWVVTLAVMGGLLASMR